MKHEQKKQNKKYELKKKLERTWKKEKKLKTKKRAITNSKLNWPWKS